MVWVFLFNVVNLIVLGVLPGCYVFTASVCYLFGGCWFVLCLFGFWIDCSLCLIFTLCLGCCCSLFFCLGLVYLYYFEWFDLRVIDFI